jgi:hypothetical protein
MRNSPWIASMAALALAAALGACEGDDSKKSAPDPTPTASTSPSEPAYTLLRNAGTGELDAGTYGLIPAGPPGKVLAVMEAAAGYRQFEGWTLVTPEWSGPFRGVGILRVDRVLGDPCGSGTHPKAASLRDPGPGVDDLAKALTEQKGTATSKPVPVTLDGYSGLYLDYQIAKNVDPAKCEGQAFDIVATDPGSPTGWWLDASSERAGIWILDVEGERVLLSWVAKPGATPEQVDELKAMVESTTFEPLES